MACIPTLESWATNHALDVRPRRKSQKRPVSNPPKCVPYCCSSTRRFALFLATVLSLSCGGAAASEKPAREWLERMIHATRTLNYDGTFVFRKGNFSESMRIIHKADHRGQRERLISLSGAAREVLRDNSTVTCILPDANSVVVGQSRANSLVGSPVLNADARLTRNYELEMAGMARVAGRLANVLKIRPKDQYRYGHQLWLDQSSGLLLKSELLGAGGESLEGIEYVNLTVSEPIPDDLLKPDTDGSRYEWVHSPAESRSPSPAKWRVGWLPDGFAMSERVVDIPTVKRMPLEHLVYTDGLAFLSVFIERTQEVEEPLTGTSRMGAVSAFGKMMGDYQITVVGEVPEETAIQVGDSVTKGE